MISFTRPIQEQNGQYMNGHHQGHPSAHSSGHHPPAHHPPAHHPQNHPQAGYPNNQGQFRQAQIGSPNKSGNGKWRSFIGGVLLMDWILTIMNLTKNSQTSQQLWYSAKPVILCTTSDTLHNQCYFAQPVIFWKTSNTCQNQ